MGIALDSSFKLYSSVLMDDNKTFGNLIISTFPFEKARVLAVLLYLHFTGQNYRMSLISITPLNSFLPIFQNIVKIST